MKRLCPYLILLIFTISLCLWGETGVEQERGFIGRSFKVTVKTEIPYSRDLKAELNLPDHIPLQLTSEPYVRSYKGLIDRGGDYIYEDFAEVVMSLASPRADIFTCSGLRLYREKFEEILPDFNLFVFNWDEKDLNYPIELFWSEGKDVLYTGEVIPLVLHIRYLENLIFPEQITIDSPSRGELELVDLPGEVDIMTFDEISLFSYPLESWYFTTNETGPVTIGGGSVLIKGVTRTIPPYPVDVLPLPDEVETSGAVGRFSVRTYLSKDEVSRGEILTCRVTLEGVGNLPYLSLPGLVLEGFEIISSKENSQIVPGGEGFSGFREREYLIQAVSEGRGSVKIDPFVWLDPETGLVNRHDESLFSFNIQGGKEETKESLRPLMIRDVKIKIAKQIFLNKLKWFFVLPGILFLVLTLFRLNKDNGKPLLLLMIFPLMLSFSLLGDYEKDVKEAEKAWENREIQRAASLYYDLYGRTNFTVFLHNYGIMSYLMGDIVEGEIAIRKSLVLIGGDPDYWRSLHSIEEERDLDNQYAPSQTFSSFWLIFSLLVLVNAILIISALHLKSKNRMLLVLITFFGILLIAVFSVILYQHFTFNRIQAIIQVEEGDLLRIPEVTAESWLSLPLGTVMHVKGEKQGYYYIETGYGLQGWIPVSHARVIGD